jgi:hypothetical protein
MPTTKTNNIQNSKQTKNPKTKPNKYSNAEPNPLHEPLSITPETHEPN